jgi:hypothetical protein
MGILCTPPLGGSHMLKNAYFLRQVENRGHAF